MKHVVCKIADVPEGGRIIVRLSETLSVGIYLIDGQFLAIRNFCPHAGAPICEGSLSGAIISDGPFERRLAYEGRILKCPWHAWEFKLPEGTTITEPVRRLQIYPVQIEAGNVIVETRARQTVSEQTS